MTPEQKLKWAVLNLAAHWADTPSPDVTAETIDNLYDALVAADGHWDAREEVRCSGTNSALRRTVGYLTERHYEHEEVTAEMPDGTWVGWTYWHGGGKFGEPSSVEWMSEAYAVEHRVEPHTILVDIFTLPPAALSNT